MTSFSERRKCCEGRPLSDRLLLRIIITIFLLIEFKGSSFALQVEDPRQVLPCGYGQTAVGGVSCHLFVTEADAKHLLSVHFHRALHARCERRVIDADSELIGFEEGVFEVDGWWLSSNDLEWSLGLRKRGITVEDAHVFAAIWRGDDELAGCFVETRRLEFHTHCSLHSLESITGIDLHGGSLEGEIDGERRHFSLGVHIHWCFLANLLNSAVVGGGFLAIVDEFEFLCDFATQAGLEAHGAFSVRWVAKEL